jgi:hypothetical protein
VTQNHSLIPSLSKQEAIAGSVQNAQCAGIMDSIILLLNTHDPRREGAAIRKNPTDRKERGKPQLEPCGPWRAAAEA